MISMTGSYYETLSQNAEINNFGARIIVNE